MIASYLNQTVARIRIIKDEYNEVTEDVLDSIPARYEKSNEIIVTDAGREQKASYRVFFLPDVDVREGDRLILDAYSSTDPGKKWLVQRVHAAQSLAAVSHLEVYV